MGAKFPIAGLLISREFLFLLIAGLSATCFFLSSLVLLFNSIASDFAIVASVLALGLILANLLQFGSDTNLPRQARFKSTDLSASVTAHLLITLLISGVLAVTLVQYEQRLSANLYWLLTWSLAVGTAGGCQYICDAFLRSRGEIFRIAITNLVLGIVALLIVCILAYLEALTPTIYVAVTVAVRICFCMSVMFRQVFSLTYNLKSICISVLSTPVGFVGAATLLILGLLDNVLLIRDIVNPEVALYINIKHFAYGVYIAAVHEGCMPLLIAYLVRNKVVDLRKIVLLAMVVAVLVASASFVLGMFVISAKTIGSTTSLELIAMVSCGIGCHVLGAFALRTYLVTSEHSTNGLCFLYLAMLAGTVGFVLTSNYAIEVIVLIWISFNVWIACAACCLCVLARTRRESLIHKNGNEVTT